jgi:AmiR/NasT family two-component response regulator
MTGEALIRELRTLRVLVLHPPDSDREELIHHLRRIGCQVRGDWPLPQTIPKDINVVFCLIDDQPNDEVSWWRRRPPIPIVAITQYESPAVLRAVLESGATGAIGKPLRAFGTLTSLIMSRAIHRYEASQELKINKLKETLRSRRLVERAVRTLSSLKQIAEDEAYDLIRQQSTSKRVSMAAIAESIIHASELFAGLETGGG